MNRIIDTAFYVCVTFLVGHCVKAADDILSGFVNVIPNTTGEESQVSIEALFNAVLRNKNMIKELFK